MRQPLVEGCRNEVAHAGRDLRRSALGRPACISLMLDDFGYCLRVLKFADIPTELFLLRKNIAFLLRQLIEHLAR